MLNPVHLRTLVEVVRVGSFAKAARTTGYTASAISQHISALERAVGATMFERRAHAIRPTALALGTAARANEAIAVLENLEQEIRHLARGSRGRLRLGTFTTAGERLVPHTVAALTRGHPDAEILLDEAEPDELLPLVRNGVLDLALVFAYDLVPRVWPAELTVWPLIDEKLVLVLPEGHPALKDGGVRMEDLAAERWVASPPGTAGSASLARLCAAYRFTPDIVFRSNDYEVVQGLVVAGTGVALVPGLAYQARAGLRGLPLVHTPSHRQVLALHRTANSNPLVPSALDALTAAGRLLASDFVRPLESDRFVDAQGRYSAS